MGEVSRREALRLMGVAPVAAAFTWSGAEAEQASLRARAAGRAAAETGVQFQPRFFTAHEYETVRVLVDLIIPADERSGSATAAGVPEFMDFMMIDQPQRQTAMRGGLAWLDGECRRRFDRPFIGCDHAQRRSVLDDIAWPRRARPELSHGVAFFNSFRDLTATGFWTTKMGMDDLRFMGNRFVAEWHGCPEDALRQLGVRYGG